MRSGEIAAHATTCDKKKNSGVANRPTTLSQGRARRAPAPEVTSRSVVARRQRGQWEHPGARRVHCGGWWPEERKGSGERSRTSAGAALTLTLSR